MGFLHGSKIKSAASHSHDTIANSTAIELRKGYLVGRWCECKIQFYLATKLDVTGGIVPVYCFRAHGAELLRLETSGTGAHHSTLRLHCPIADAICTLEKISGYNIQ